MSAQFVLLRHDCPPAYLKPSHWDFMLENEGVLLTWQLNELPAAWTEKLGLKPSVEGDSIEAKRLANHRLAYLDYEGPISGDRGSITRLDRGAYSWVQQSEGRLVVQLQGSTLSGNVTLASEGEAWILTVKTSRD